MSFAREKVLIATLEDAILKVFVVDDVARRMVVRDGGGSTRQSQGPQMQERRPNIPFTNAHDMHSLSPATPSLFSHFLMFFLECLTLQEH